MADIEPKRQKAKEDLDGLNDEDWFFVITAKNPEKKDTDWSLMGYIGESDGQEAHVNMAGTHLNYIDQITTDDVDLHSIAHVILEAAEYHTENVMWERPD